MHARLVYGMSVRSYRARDVQTRAYGCKSGVQQCSGYSSDGSHHKEYTPDGQ